MYTYTSKYRAWVQTRVVMSMAAFASLFPEESHYIYVYMYITSISNSVHVRVCNTYIHICTFIYIKVSSVGQDTCWNVDSRIRVPLCRGRTLYICIYVYVHSIYLSECVCVSMDQVWVKTRVSLSTAVFASFQGLGLIYICIYI